MTPLDNLRRIVAGWRGEWRVDAHDGITLSHDGEEWPIGALDGDAVIMLVELLNAIRPAVDGATAEIERLTAELDAARQIADARREWLGTGDAAKSPPRTDTAAIAADMLACAEAWAPGAMLMGNVRADEIAAVCRELAGARTVPPDVEAAIDARDAEWQNRIMPFHKGFDGDGCESGDPIDWTLSALSQAKCTVEDAVGDFIEGHAKRLCDAAGGVWHDEYDSWASQVHDVLNHLRGGEDGAVIDGRASQPATVGIAAAIKSVERIESTSKALGYSADYMAAIDRVLSCLRAVAENGGSLASTVDGGAGKPATVGGLLATEADALLCRWYAAKQDAIGAFVDLENLRRPDPDDSWAGGIGRHDPMPGAEKRAADTKERLVDVTNKVIAAMTRGPIVEVPDVR